MQIDFARYKALTFDCYGTLIDWETGITERALPWLRAALPGLQPDLLHLAFTAYQAQHQQIRPALPYPEVLRRTYADIRRGLGLAANDDEAAGFAASVGDWPAFPDTVAALAEWQGRYALGILSNVDNASLARTLMRLKAPFAVTVTAEDVGAYKPDLAHFHEAFRRFQALGIAADEILHIAQSKRHDHGPANRLGLASVWVNRQHGRDRPGIAFPSEANPAMEVTGLPSLAEMIRQTPLSA